MKKNVLKCLLMQLTFAITLLFSLNIIASGYSQKKISVNVKDVTLIDLIGEVKKQSNYSFLYNDEEVEVIKNLSLQADDQPVETILTKVLSPVGFGFEKINGVIIIKPLKKEIPLIRTISGTVVTKDGVPLTGVTIAYLADSLMVGGTATDLDGNFSASINDNVTQLRFSMLGYKAQTINVTANDTYHIVLEESSEELDEIVVTGYQEIKRERMTGSVNTVTAASIESRGYNQIDEILEATVPGLTHIATGRPGQDAAITIRGINSLTGSTAPQWIVDGMPMQGEIPNIDVSGNQLQTTLFTTGIGNISPDDIESITVLRDAAATAIYGSRAANGVIVIKTKSGRVGKTFFNFSSNTGVTEKPESNVQMMNSAQKIHYERELYNDIARFNHHGRVYDIMRDVNYGAISQEEAEAQINQLSLINTDWFDEIYRRGYSHQYSLSMQGGTMETQYYASVNYLNEEGAEPVNKFERMGLNMKLTHNPSKKLLITLGLNGTLRKDRATASRVNLLEYAMYANPYEKPFNDDGSYAYDQSYNVTDSRIREGQLAWGKFNMLHDLENNTNTSRYTDAQARLQMEWQVFPFLMFQTNGVYNINSNHNNVIEGNDTYTNFTNNWLNDYSDDNEIDHSSVLGSLREATGYSNSYTLRNTLQYNQEFDGKHFVSALLGQVISNRSSKNSFNYSPIYDQLHGTVGFPDMSGVDASTINWGNLGGTGEAIDKSSSFFGTASYSYMDRYIVSGSLRYDGSSIVGNENQFTPLWNVSLRYNLHNENFFQGMPYIDMFSLRVGYGYTGTIDRTALPHETLFFNQFFLYDNEEVPTSFRFANPNIKWQTKRDRNIGIDLRIFERFELTANYYDNLTFDVLDWQGLPYSSGVNRIKKNVADIVNRGWELSLRTLNIKTPKFSWSTSFNVAINHNEITNTDYKSLEDVPYADRNAFVQNYPVNGWYGFKFAGVDPGTGQTLVFLENGETFNLDNISNVTLNLEPPSVYFLGEGYPPITGGISTTFYYNRISLTANAEFKTGHTIPAFDTNRSVDSKNRHVTDVFRWRQPGDVTNIPAYFGFSNTAFNTYLYDVNLEKGDYMRLNLLSLGYNFDSELIGKLGLTRARFSLNARNLFTLTKYRGIDPSLLGEFGYPNSKSYTLTFNVSF